MAEQTEMPEGWRCVGLGELLREVDVRQGDLPKTEAEALEVLSLTKNDGLILQSVRFGKRIATDDTSKYKVVREGQIVYNPYVIWEGAVHALRKHRAGLVSPVYPVWETVEPDAGFVDYLLRTPPLIDAYNRVCSGAVNRRRSIREEAFIAIKVTLPSLPERRAIAEALRKVQRAKEATEKAIAATRHLKASLMKHLFTYGPASFDRVDQVPLKETEIGDLPQHWRVIELGNVAEIRTSTSSPTSIPKSSPKSPTTRVLFLKVSDMNHPQNQRCVLTAAIWFDVDSEYENILNLIPKGAVVLPKRGAAIATNKKRMTTCACLLDPNLVGVIPGEALIGDYLYAWFERFDLRTITDITTLPQINKKDLEPLLVPVPPLHEQHQIAAQLAAVDAKLAAEEKRRGALDALFKSLLHHLMTGKLRL